MIFLLHSVWRTKFNSKLFEWLKSEVLVQQHFLKGSIKIYHKTLIFYDIVAKRKTTTQILTLAFIPSLTRIRLKLKLTDWSRFINDNTVYVEYYWNNYLLLFAFAMTINKYNIIKLSGRVRGSIWGCDRPSESCACLITFIERVN